MKVADGSAELDGLVFDTPSSSKVVVAVVDPTRGPLFRTVNPNALTEREQEGPNDRRAASAGAPDAATAERRSARRDDVAGNDAPASRAATAHRPTGR